MLFPSSDRSPRDREPTLAADEAGRLTQEAAELVREASGDDWYAEDNNIDRAVATLCQLRRAAAGQKGASNAGDEAVRAVLAASDHDAVVWLASRTVSFMDEQGFPDFVLR